MAYKLSRKKTKKYGGVDEKPLSMDKVVIHENNGYATGTVTLNGKDDSILIDNGRLLYVEQESKPEDQVNIKSIVQGSAIKSLKRSFLSGENIFINKFTGSDSGKPVKVHFGSAAPGDIIKIYSVGVDANIDSITGQAKAGRAQGGGLKIGTMERDSLLASGISNFVKESFVEKGDKTLMTIIDENEGELYTETTKGFKLFKNELTGLGLKVLPML